MAPEMNGVTTRIVSSYTRSMAEIVANDQPKTISPWVQKDLRKEPEGPKPIMNPNATTLLLQTTLRRSPVQIETTTQSIRSNFLAIWGSYHNNIPGRESAFTPPDNCGDVGLTQIITTANTRMKVFNKPSATSVIVSTPTGNSTQTPPAIFNVNLESFFSNSTLGISQISDPHVRFDRLTKRWFIIAVDVDHNVNNYCCIAVSDNEVISNSTNFKFYFFNVSGTGGVSNEFFDYPTLGIDKYALNIGGNMFTNSLSFAGCNMWVINKDSILAGVLKVTAFNHSATNTDMYTPQGVHNDDPSAVSGYFIGTSSSLYGKINVRRVNHTSVIPTLSADIPLNTIQTYAPENVIIPFGDSIDGNDHRLCAAMIMRNKLTGKVSLWTANGSLSDQSGTVDPSTGDRDGIVWYEITNLETSPTISQSGRLFDNKNALATAVNYIYPTIATSGQGHSIMGFTSGGKSKFPQASVAGRYNSDGAGVFQLPVDLTNASSRYNPGSPRWGDFTQTVVDPSDNMTMWTFTQYADTVNSWGVRAGQLIAPPPSIPKFDTIPVCNTSTIKLSGLSVNNSGFFDPGADLNGPGFNHLNVTVTGPSPVTVTNVQFINQDTIQATFFLPDGTLAGTYTVNVINPDGQTSSTTFVLATTCVIVQVTIVDFTGSKGRDGVDLKWITSNEVDLKNFIVEKSPDGITFENFATVDAVGNTSTNTSYSTVDHHPFPNFSYYRLKIYNNKGNFKYSKVIKVETDQRNVALTRLYPNPAKNTINVELYSTDAEVVYINVFDYAGSRVISQAIQLSAGINKIPVKTDFLPVGGYVLELIDNNNSISDKVRFIKTN